MPRMYSPSVRGNSLCGLGGVNRWPLWLSRPVSARRPCFAEDVRLSSMLEPSRAPQVWS